MKKLIICLFVIVFFLSFSAVYAKNESKAVLEETTLKVSGVCSEDVVIVLYPKDTKGKESIYSSGSTCVNKKYEYIDDLQEWNLPESDYYVSVTGKESKKEHIRNLVTYKRPEVKGVAQEVVEPEEDSYWRALDDIKNYVIAIQDRIGFANNDLEASDHPESVKLSAQGIFVLMMEGTQNLLGLVDSVREILTAPAATLVSPVPTGDEPELISPLVTPEPSPSPSPSPSPTIAPVHESTGSAVLSL